MKEKVIFFDTTLRDGEQSPGVSLNLKEKLQIGIWLEKLGVDVLETGFPATSPGDFESVQYLAWELKKIEVTALSRAIKKDIDVAWEAIKDAVNPRIHTFIATSDIHLEYKLKKTRAEALNMAQAAVEHAVGYTGNVEFSAEDATRSNLDFVCKVFETAIDAGATTVNFPDTVGYATPQDFGEMISYIIKNTPNIHKAILSVHCHNDLGMATANTIEAIRQGARQVECTINGIGERAGNAALEELVMAIRVRQDILPYRTNIFTPHIMATSKLVSSLTGMPIQPNKAIVGANAFAHEAGIHQHGVIECPLTYEVINPKDIGFNKGTLVMGKHSGKHALKIKLEELGYELSDKELAQVFDKFKSLADKKKEIYPEDLEVLFIEEILKIPVRYELIDLQVTSGNGVVPTATVSITIDGNKVQGVTIGTGSIDAAFNVIARLVETHSYLSLFTINSISGGTDALGKVAVRLEENGYIVTGQGADSDIITASVLAYLNALNRLEYIKMARVDI